MTSLEIFSILVAGASAGAINTIVGSGTLITFPTLIAFGVPPVTANVSNSIGLFPGSVSGAVGYRRELVGQRSRVLSLSLASFIGGLIGAAFLLVLPPRAFDAIVPALIILGLIMVVFQRRVADWVARRHDATGGIPAQGVWWVWPLVLLSGVYGGYFGAAQGVLLMAILGIGVVENLNRLNGLKNVLAATVNAVAGAVFCVVAAVDWQVVALIAIGSVAGAQAGATFGRRLPERWLRAAILFVGSAALLVFLSR